MISIFLIVIVTFLILFLAFLSMSEISLFSLSTFTVKTYENDKNPRKKLIAKLLEKPGDLLITIMMMCIISDILVQNILASFWKSSASFLLNVGVPLVLTLLLGEVIPKSFAYPKAKKTAYLVAPIIAILFKFLRPMRHFLSVITNYVSAAMFSFLKKEKPLSFDELDHIIQTSKKKGILNIDEANLIEGCLKLQNSISKEHMKPKEEIRFFNINDDINNLLKIFSKESFSRIPVCDNDIDHLLGIISLKRFFFYQEHIQNKEDLKKYLKKPFFVPENISSWTLLSELRAKNEDMALFVDEYGSILGIITQEDLVEKVIGEIFDKKELSPKYSLTDDVLIASGQMAIDDLEEIFDLQLPRLGKSVTIGGWLTDQMGDIPQPGTKFSTKELFFYVIEGDVKKVKKIYIRFLKPLKKKKHG